MNAYVYQAALLCEACAVATMAEADADPRLDSFDKETSDHYPQGPYTDGGGGADCPQHCDHCGAFLENPLTGDGVEYVRDAVDDALAGKGAPLLGVVADWSRFYGIATSPEE